MTVLIPCPKFSVRYQCDENWTATACPVCRTKIQGRKCLACGNSLVGVGLAPCICPNCNEVVPYDGHRPRIGDAPGLRAISEIPDEDARVSRFICPQCGRWTHLEPDATDVTCFCGAVRNFAQCVYCSRPQTVPGKGSVPCAGCGRKLRLGGSTQTASFSKVLAAGDPCSVSAWPTAEEVPEASLGPFEILDGAGWAPKIGTTANLVIYGNRVIVEERHRRTTIDLDTVTDVRVEGRSVTKGGGYIGGGIGVKGAAEGMLISSALNALTAKTAKWVTIGLVTDDGWADLKLADFDAVDIRNAVRMFSDRAFSNRARPSSPVTLPPTDAPADAQNSETDEDLVSKLERLAKLRAAGALSEDEFSLAKGQLLPPRS